MKVRWLVGCCAAAALAGCGSTQPRAGSMAGCGGGGAGAGCGGGDCPTAAAIATPVGGEMSAATREALAAALADERRARAFYQAVLDRHGRVMPFANIVNAEVMHARHVADLMTARGLEVPPDAQVFPAGEVPDTVAACCEMAMQAEIDNVALYDRWLDKIDDDSVREVLGRLRWMSQERHLPAFERFAGRG